LYINGSFVRGREEGREGGKEGRRAVGDDSRR